MLFRMIYDEKLAQAAYLIGCQRTGDAIIIDPERDIQRYLDIAAANKVKITAIAETHIHADFLSGAREMAEHTNAKLYLSDEGDADWKYQWLDKKSDGGSYHHQLLKNGDVFHVGNIRFDVIHTPGHTPEHICFLVTDEGGGVDEPMGIATGDFVFVGSVGRPDLLETAAGESGVMEASAKDLYQSLKSFHKLPDYLQLWPGHGAGSACGKALGSVPQSTVGYEKRFNAAIHETQSEQIFVGSILQGQPEPPFYFARMKRDNKIGPPLLNGKALPKLLPNDVGEIEKYVRANTVFLDTRSWEAYCEGHLSNALFTPLDKSFPTIAGSYVDEHQQILLVVEQQRLQEAITDLIRIGLDNWIGFITPKMMADVAKKSDKIVNVNRQPIEKFVNNLPTDNTIILDVRNADEYANGHLRGSLNVAHTRLLPRLAEIPRNRPIWVHCLGSTRSAYATGFLQAQGFEITTLSGGYSGWVKSGGEVEKE